jgi:chorismate synthase
MLHFYTAGESHGPALLAILEGMPAGLPLTPDVINADLARRQLGYGAGPRMKIEKDTAQILSGVMDGQTIGAPLAILLDNRDYEKWRDQAIPSYPAPRPGHADLSAAIKYGYGDLRPSLERASARETAARVAVGAICRHLLEQFGIQVAGYVSAIGEIQADLSTIPLTERPSRARQNEVACPDAAAAEVMYARIRKVMDEKDTLGGIIEVIALGVPPGLGSHVHWERRLDGRLGAALLSIPAIKGVEIGPAFANAALPGTQVHDAIRLAPNGDLTRPTNNCGGLEGGITTGQPLHLRAAMKPIATTLSPQQTVDLSSGQETSTRYERSDFCPVPRAVVVLEAMVAFVLADALLEKLGGDSLEEMRSRLTALRQVRLSDLPMDGKDHTWWPAV